MLELPAVYSVGARIGPCGTSILTWFVNYNHDEAVCYHLSSCGSKRVSTQGRVQLPGQVLPFGVQVSLFVQVHHWDIALNFKGLFRENQPFCYFYEMMIPSNILVGKENKSSW